MEFRLISFGIDGYNPLDGDKGSGDMLVDFITGSIAAPLSDEKFLKAAKSKNYVS